MKHSSRILSLILSPFLLATLACSVFSVDVASTPVVITVVVLATASPATPQPQLTLAPAVVPNATPISIPGPAVNYDNVTLNLDINIARGVGAQIIPPSEVSVDAPPFALHPQYTQLTLDGYPISQQYRQPTLAVYKLDEILKLTPDLAPEVDKFKAMLQDKPATPDSIPTIPITNAAQVFRAQVKYLSFNGGSGVGFITQYAQAPLAINNGDAFYMFEGLTTDGLYFVQAQFPLNSTKFGFSQDDFGGVTVDFGASDAGTQFQTYLDNLVTTLNTLPADQFTPNLDALDGVIASLTIK